MEFLRFLTSFVFKVPIEDMTTPTPQPPSLNFNFKLKLGMHLVLVKVFGKQMEQETAVPSYLLHIKSIDIRKGEYGEQDKKDIFPAPAHSLPFALYCEIYAKFARDRVRRQDTPKDA